MGIAGDPFFCRGGQPTTGERDEWFERILRQGREAAREREQGGRDESEA
jgi:hypothetical protein